MAAASPANVTEMVYFPRLKAAVAVQVNTSVPRATGKPLYRFATELAETIARETGITNEAAKPAATRN